ncbi:MAG: Uncharacterised protein [Flavobacterium sp. SCGC AAA160-P02]|nr:MAG: Uncharacterised protein [Flavobacterium sp. SCGC AAA160-P02]
MKKIIITCILFLGVHHFVKAQLQFGVKAGVNYNSNSFNDVSNDVLNGAKTKTGYHTGFWFSAKLPGVGFYIRPELVYTELNNDVNYNTFETLQATDYKFKKVDVPILFGKKSIFGIGNIFAGPSFQYIISSGFGINDLTKVSINQFSLGIQLGAGIEFGKLGIDVRWERGLSKIETFFVDNLINRDVNFDTRVNQIIFGLSYKL